MEIRNVEQLCFAVFIVSCSLAKTGELDTSESAWLKQTDAGNAGNEQPESRKLSFISCDPKRIKEARSVDLQ